MKISFELNPPRIVKDHHFELVMLNQELQKFTQRASELVHLVDGIHLTDSVLGIPRISSITAANFIKRSGNPLKLSCSVRVRDRNYTSMCQFVSDAILSGVQRVLVLMGDDPIDGAKYRTTLRLTGAVTIHQVPIVNRKIQKKASIN